MEDRERDLNVLKNKGYNLEHSFGHGKQNLATILVSLNLLAFAFHTVCDLGDALWRNARAKLGPRYNVLSKLAAITVYLIFPSWDDLLLTLAFAKPPRFHRYLPQTPAAAPLKMRSTHCQTTKIRMRIAGFGRDQLICDP